MSKTLTLIKESEARWVDLRFTDTRGKEQHVSIPISEVGDDFFEEGKMFDGSSIEGWKGINESDMILLPDDSTAVLDPFTDEPTVIVRCDIIEPSTMQGYERDPRSVAKRAEQSTKSCRYYPPPYPPQLLYKPTTKKTYPPFSLIQSSFIRLL